MSGALVSAIVVLGLAIIVVRRRSVAIVLLAAQSLALGIGALDARRRTAGASYLVASIVLLSKAVVHAAAAVRADPPHAGAAPRAWPRTGRSCASRCAGARRAAAPACSFRHSGSGTRTPSTRPSRSCWSASRSSSPRRPILFQLLGLIVAENGLALLAVSVPGGLSYVVELGALFDLALVVDRRGRVRAADPHRARAPATPSCCGACVTDLVPVLVAVHAGDPARRRGPGAARAQRPPGGPPGDPRPRSRPPRSTLALAAIALARGGRPALHGQWYLIDGASGVLLAVIAVVGLCSALVSPAYLRTSGRSWTTAARSRSLYYAALFVFWAALLAVPIAGNLAVVWLIVEATTAASALLVAFTGRRERTGGRLEVPRPHDARDCRSRCSGSSCWRSARRTPATTTSTRSTGARFTSPPAACRAARRWSRSCCCWRGWPRRSAGLPSTTGFPTPTARHRRRSARCSPRRCCRPCC